CFLTASHLHLILLILLSFRLQFPPFLPFPLPQYLPIFLSNTITKKVCRFPRTATRSPSRYLLTSFFPRVMNIAASACALPSVHP
ncbi:hypothetical protein PENTCL1PPCAC_25795, partial [Pristionchus entomophagus]